MNDDQDKQQHVKENKGEKGSPAQWLPFIHALLGTFTLMGTGIGGMLHFLNVGEGYPDYQIFVLRTSTFVLVTIFFFLILVTMAMFAAEADKRDRHRADRKSVEFAIRGLTFVFMLMLALSAYGILRAGWAFFIEGMQEYIEVLRTAQQGVR